MGKRSIKYGFRELPTAEESIVRLRLASTSVTWLLVVACLSARADDRPGSVGAYRVSLDRGHPWRPPFGLDRVGSPPAVVVHSPDRPSGAAPILAVFKGGKEIGRQTVRFPEKPPYSARVSIPGDADEVVLLDASSGARVELARAKVVLPVLEADAVARAGFDREPGGPRHDPGPLGLAAAGAGPVRGARRRRDRPATATGPMRRLSAWYDSRPDRKSTAAIGLPAGTLRRHSMNLPDAPPGVLRDSVTVVLEDGDGRAFWRKSIPAMLVAKPPARPRFGATREKLRYDAPISVRDPRTGAYSTMPYEGAWPAGLDDVVVSLPNGARFVFWRGSSYIPFWAGRHNTGACYEWAEIISQPAGAVDCVEPLMDKELRYSRVAIVESTAARVHVRWTYQSTDLLYKVWGDSVVEDYYFYPDGFGTRVVNLKADPANNYELSEFIILTPPGAYPFAVLPDDPVDALFLDGRKHAFRFPNPSGEVGSGRSTPAAYRPSIGCGCTRPRSWRRCTSIRTRRSGRRWSSGRSSTRARWSRRATGGATGRWRGERDGQRDRRPGRADPLPQQRDELGRHTSAPAPDRRARRPSIPWAGRGR